MFRTDDRRASDASSIKSAVRFHKGRRQTCRSLSVHLRQLLYAGLVLLSGQRSATFGAELLPRCLNIDQGLHPQDRPRCKTIRQTITLGPLRGARAVSPALPSVPCPRRQGLAPLASPASQYIYLHFQQILATRVRLTKMTIRRVHKEPTSTSSSIAPEIDSKVRKS